MVLTNQCGGLHKGSLFFFWAMQRHFWHFCEVFVVKNPPKPQWFTNLNLEPYKTNQFGKWMEMVISKHVFLCNDVESFKWNNYALKTHGCFELLTARVVKKRLFQLDDFKLLPSTNAETITKHPSIHPLKTGWLFGWFFRERTKQKKNINVYIHQKLHGTLPTDP